LRIQQYNSQFICFSATLIATFLVDSNINRHFTAACTRFNGRIPVSENPTLDETDKKILQTLQDNFPLVEHPWKEIARQLDLTEPEVLTRLQRLQNLGVTKKIGPIIDTAKIGLNAATLVAMKIPQTQIAHAAAVINQYSAITHNYQREHEYNIWFTITTPTTHELNAILADIQQKTATHPQNILNLPTKQRFKINVRFQLTQGDPHGPN
jgi:DNA-binding Lrp family transcriptional regulator